MKVSVPVFYLHEMRIGKVDVVERRLELIKILCRRRHDIMPNLATEFGVSVRTIQRDIDEISRIVPIYIRTGKYGGGVYIDEDYYMDRMYMNERELNVLRKIKNGYANNHKYTLNNEDILTIDRLIKDYTRPDLTKNSCLKGHGLST